MVYVSDADRESNPARCCG